MYVEDLLIAINERLLIAFYHGPHRPFDGLPDGEWHRNFITNVANHAMSGHQLSTNQSMTILKLVGKIRQSLVAYGMATDLDIANMLAMPQHRRPLYESVAIPREVRYLGSNYLGFRFKQNDLIIKRIKSFGQPCMTNWLKFELAENFSLIDRPRFDWGHRIWIVPVFRHNINHIMALLREYRFGIDPVTADYLQLAQSSLDMSSTFTMADEFIVGNVRDNPLLASWMTENAEGLTL